MYSLFFRKEEIVEMLDLGNDDYFKDKATMAVTNARTALEMILEGQYIEPKPWDDLLVHYSVFDKALQQINFKIKIRPEVQEAMASYVTTLELLMVERAKKNLKFATRDRDWETL